MAACTSFYLVCIPYLLGCFDFLKHRMMSRTLCLCSSYRLQTLMYRVLKLLHVFHGLSCVKERDWVLLQLLKTFFVVNVLVCQFEDLIRHLLRGAGALHACFIEIFWLIKVVPQELRLPPDKVCVGWVLGQPIIQTLQCLLCRFLERIRTKGERCYKLVVKLTEGSISLEIWRGCWLTYILFLILIITSK